MTKKSKAYLARRLYAAKREIVRLQDELAQCRAHLAGWHHRMAGQ